MIATKQAAQTEGVVSLASQIKLCEDRKKSDKKRRERVKENKKSGKLEVQ